MAFKAQFIGDQLPDIGRLALFGQLDRLEENIETALQVGGASTVLGMELDTKQETQILGKNIF